MIRRTEIERYARAVLDVFVLMQLGAVISSDGAEGHGITFDKFNESLVGDVGFTAGELPDMRELRPPVDQGDDAVLVVGTDDSVDFVVTESGAVVRANWAF